MMEAILFWLSLPVALAILALLFLILGALCTFPGWMRRARCKHNEYREDRACNGICTACRKNLGFIQPLRADRSKREV